MKRYLISYMLHGGSAAVLASMFVCGGTAPLVMSGEPAAERSGKAAPHDASPGVLLSPAEERERFHRILDRARNQEDGVHGACGELIHVGDLSSIPHLIRVLRLFPDEEIAGTRRGIVCTQGHCVMALERITGAKVGVSYSSWKRWWSENHPGQPLEEPHNKPLNPSGAKNAPAG